MRGLVGFLRDDLQVLASWPRRVLWSVTEECLLPLPVILRSSKTLNSSNIRTIAVYTRCLQVIELPFLEANICLSVRDVLHLANFLHV
jgi:hypothetical protein